MFQTSIISFLVFAVSSWLVAAVNTNQWLPPDFAVIPESPRVFAGLLTVYLILLATCFLIRGIERAVYRIAAKLPRLTAHWIYNVSFLLFSFGIIKLVWFGVSDRLISSGYYRSYAAQFYSSSGIGDAQLNAIFLFTFLILLVASFFSMRRHIV